MKKFISILISFFASYFCIIIFGKTIPAGYEMGAIAVAFVALLFSFLTFILITIIYVAKSTSINEKAKEAKSFKYEITYVAISAIITTSVFSLSIWSELNNENAHAKKTKKNIEIGEENITKVKLKLINSENYFKPHSLSISDSSSICSFFKDFITKEESKKDSVWYKTFNYFFNLNFEKKDSLNSRKNTKHILKTFSIDYIGYSLNREFSFVIITYEETKKYANTLLLIGQRHTKYSEYYKLPILFNDDVYFSKNYLLYKLTERFNDIDFKRNYENPLDKDFWQSKLFDTIYINERKNYRYQLEYSDTKKYSSNSILPSIKVKFIPAKK